MNDVDRERGVRRILVALDASPHSLAALQAAVELAAHLDAEVIGLFVEDINLLRLADLELAHEVRLYSTTTSQLNRSHLERQLRSQARLARRALAAIARQERIRWSFQVVQGMIAREILEAAAESDLILLGKSGWTQRRQMGSTARTVVSLAPGRAMLIQSGAHLGVPVGVVFVGSELGQKALLAAEELLSHRLGFVVAFILGESQDQTRACQSEISAWARARQLHVHCRWLVPGSASKLVELVKAENCGVLVLPGDERAFRDEDLAEIVNGVDCPVLLIRS